MLSGAVHPGVNSGGVCVCVCVRGWGLDALALFPVSFCGWQTLRSGDVGSGITSMVPQSPPPGKSWVCTSSPDCDSLRFACLSLLIDNTLKYGITKRQHCLSNKTVMFNKTFRRSFERHLQSRQDTNTRLRAFCYLRPELPLRYSSMPPGFCSIFSIHITTVRQRNVRQ